MLFYVHLLIGVRQMLCYHGHAVSTYGHFHGLTSVAIGQV